MTREEKIKAAIDDYIDNYYEDEKILRCDGFDEEVIGIAHPISGQPVLAYDRDAIIDRLVSRDGMSEIDASEHFDFNIGGAYMGPGTPIFISRIPELDEAREEPEVPVKKK
jgi:hypothetical protein